MQTIHKAQFAIVIICLLVSGASAELFRGLNSVYRPTVQEIKNASKDDYLVLLYFYREACDLCRTTEELISQFASEMHYIVKTLVIDCDSTIYSEEDLKTIPVCSKESAQSLPVLIFYEPAQGSSKAATPHMYAGKGEIRSLKTFAGKLLPYYGKIIKTSEELNEELKDLSIPNKVLLFTNKNETPGIYKGLTAEFRERLIFFEIHREDTDLVSRFDVAKYPTLIVLSGKENFHHYYYHGQMKAHAIHDWLNQYALPKKYNFFESLKQKPSIDEFIKEIPKADLANKNMIFIESKTDFEKINEIIDRPVILQIVKDFSTDVFKETIAKYPDSYYFATFRPSDEKDVTYCQTKFKTSMKMPYIVLYPPGDSYVKDKKKTVFSPDINAYELASEVKSNLANKIRSVHSNEVPYFYEGAMKKNKLALIYYGKSPAPLFFHLIVNKKEIKDNVVACESLFPSPEAMRSALLNDLPAIVGVYYQIGGKIKENRSIRPKFFHYQGEHNFNEFDSFLETFLKTADNEIIDNEQDVEEDGNDTANEEIERNNEKVVEKVELQLWQSSLIKWQKKIGYPKIKNDT